MEKRLIEKNVVRNRIMTVVFCVLSVIWMVVIYSFSAQDAKQSTRLSDPLTNAVVEKLGAEDGENLKEIHDSVSRVVRKTGHVLMFALLAVLWYFAVGSAKGVSKNYLSPAVISVPICEIYAAFDELHQTFVKGRSGRAEDVLIDTVGILIGTAVAILIVRRIRRYIAQKEILTKRGE